MSVMKESPIIIIVGTRPEGIKMAPVYHALKRAGIPVVLCSTMQHTHLLDEVFELFGIVPDIRLNIMRPGQDLFYLTQAILQKTKEVFLSVQPSLVLVQGDTTSTMAATMAAFYLSIPVGHVEAGLRTDDVTLPFPEEMNRRVVSSMASYHFAPTPAAMAHLLRMGIAQDRIFCTGNTIVDAIAMVKDKILHGQVIIRDDIKEIVTVARQEDRELALLTVHRRESFNGPIESILKTVKRWALEHPETIWFYPYHPNPMVVNAIASVDFRSIDNIYLCEPLAYKELVYLLDKVDFVLTDSGGIQEEAVSLSKPVLVLREKTERMEGIFVGGARIVGSSPYAIEEGIAWARSFNGHLFKQVTTQVYGDGHAAEKIVAFIQAQNDRFIDESADYMPSQSVVASVPKKEYAMRKVSVIGLGYIGLPTAIVAAESGYEVAGFDIDQARIDKIMSGNPIIHEPEAYEKLNFVLGSHHFRASTQLEQADFYIVAVPTPITPDKKADLSYVYAAIDSIAVILKKDDVIIVESTIPVGTTKKIADYLTRATGLRAGTDFYIAHCPERVLPGNIFYELVANDRIIGGINERSVKKAREFYAPFVSGKLYMTNAQTAEMVKLVENSSRDVQLAFAHQIGSMAESIGLNPYEVINLANKHPRVSILRPTCGVGGHCLAVDPWFLVESFPQHSPLIKTAREVNDAKPQEVVATIAQEVAHWRLNNAGRCTILLLGVTYKPNVEDLRESPAMTIVKSMAADQSVDVLISDPHADNGVLTHLFGDRAVPLMTGLQQADIVIFLVAHDRFKLLDRSLVKDKRVLDFCGILYEPANYTDDDKFSWSEQSSYQPPLIEKISSIDSLQ